MKLNIHNLTSVECLNCGKEVWFLIDIGIDGPRLAVEPCRECGAMAYFDGVETEMKSKATNTYSAPAANTKDG